MKKQILISLISLSPILTINAQWNDNQTFNIGSNGLFNGIRWKMYYNTSDKHIASIEAADPLVDWGGVIKFSTAPGQGEYNVTERMRITQNGFIGIGTTNPAYQLDVIGTIRANTLYSLNKPSGYNLGEIIGIRADAGYSNQGNNVGDATAIGILSNVGSDWGSGGKIVGIRIQPSIFNWQSANEIKGLEIRATLRGVGSSLSGIEYGIYQESTTANNYFAGNTGIGTTAPAYKLDVCGTIRAKEVKVDLQGTCVPDFVFKSDYKLMDLKKLEEFVRTNQHLPEIATEKEMVENGVNMKELQMKLLQKIEELTLYTIEQNKKIAELEKQNAKINALEKKIEKIEAASK